MSTITFSKLGELGRLGNQYFQFASTVGIAMQNGFDYGFKTNPFKNGNIPYYSKNLATREHYETRFEYDVPVLDRSVDYDLIGYFQSYRYFAHHWERMRHYFEFDPSMVKVLKHRLTEIASDRITVSVHVRRGDYMNLQQYHPVQPMSYFLQAMGNFNTTNTQFIVFSDDPKWCEENFKLTAPYIHFYHETEIMDLCMMSLCDHNIISNSSFSWWGAWLNTNPEKRVYSPKTWFGPAYSNKSTRDLIPHNWIQI